MVLLRRPGDLRDLRPGPGEPSLAAGAQDEFGAGLPQREHVGKELVVEDGVECLLEGEGRLVEVLDRPEALLLADPFGRRDHPRDQREEHVQGVVVGERLQPPGEGDEGGEAPFLGHAGDRLRPHRAGGAGQGAQPPLREAREVEGPRAERADLPEAVQRPDHPPAADARGRLAQPIERRLSHAGFDQEEALQARPLPGVQEAGQPGLA